jgi:hypothetical protein
MELPICGDGNQRRTGFCVKGAALRFRDNPPKEVTSSSLSSAASWAAEAKSNHRREDHQTNHQSPERPAPEDLKAYDVGDCGSSGGDVMAVILAEKTSEGGSDLRLRNGADV